ncbi:CRISPR-associated protein Cas5 [Longibacter sp.]
MLQAWRQPERKHGLPSYEFPPRSTRLQ